MAKVVGLAMLASPSFAHDQADAKQAIEALSAALVEKFSARDASGIAALYTSDGILVLPKMTIVGRDNLQHCWQEMIDSGRIDLRYTSDRIQTEGNAVIETGDFSFRQGSEVTGKFVNVYEWNGRELMIRVHSFILAR